MSALGQKRTCRVKAAPQASSTFKHEGVVIRCYFDILCELQSVAFDRFECLFLGHSQLRFWTAWFPKDRCFVARAFVPVNDHELAIWFQCARDSLREPSTVRDSMKRIRHKNKI